LLSSRCVSFLHAILTNLTLHGVKNAELLAFHQDDTVGTPAKPYGTTDTSPPEYYAGNSSKGAHVFILNTSADTANKTIIFTDVPGLGSGTYQIHDMWTGFDVGTFSGSWSTSLAAHDTGAWRITPVDLGQVG
jgi:alpha-galactosidase